MTPTRAQRTWHSLSTKWLSVNPYGAGNFTRHPRKNTRRKIKKGVLANLIPVEVVNAITGEISKGYMRDFSVRRLRRWLGYHNYRAQVEQVSLSNKVTLSRLTEEERKDFPILIKLGKYQVPYLIDHSRFDILVRGKQTIAFQLKTVDNLKYLEIIAQRKEKVMKLFNKIKRAKKRDITKRSKKG